MELKGRTAIVTGSSGKLGEGITLALAEAGCNCICHYRKGTQRAERLVEEIEKRGRKAVSVQADLSSGEQIDRMFAEIEGFSEEMGTPVVLVNSAAVFERRALAEVRVEDTVETFSVNLMAPILTSRNFAKLIRQKFPEAQVPVAKIVNVVDVGGIRPWAEYVLYCSSKAGLIGATKSLAKELAPAICVNAVAPGTVRWAEGLDESEKSRQLSFVPAGRIGEVSEVTSAILFLLQNDYVTGQVLCVDGGRSI